MRNRLILILTAVLLLPACGDSGPGMTPLSDSAVVLAFGDSLTAGYGTSSSESYPARLASLSGLNVINAGISGEVSALGLKRLPALLDKHAPDLVILCHGGNDFLRKLSMTDMENNIREMIRLAREKGAEVMMLGVPKPGLFLSSYEAYERIANDTGVVFIDDLLPEILGDKSMKSDTVHPNRLGYQVMAETIHAELKDRGAL